MGKTSTWLLLLHRIFSSKISLDKITHKPISVSYSQALHFSNCTTFLQLALLKLLFRHEDSTYKNLSGMPHTTSEWLPSPNWHSGQSPGIPTLQTRWCYKDSDSAQQLTLSCKYAMHIIHRSYLCFTQAGNPRSCSCVPHSHSQAIFTFSVGHCYPVSRLLMCGNFHLRIIYYCIYHWLIIYHYIDHFILFIILLIYSLQLETIIMKNWCYYSNNVFSRSRQV